jgi:hypothetical protein
VLSDNSLDDIRKSLRKLSLESGLFYGSVHKATKILKLHPYHIHAMHELEEPNKEKLLQYCRWFTHFIGGGVDIVDKVFCNDEAWLYLSGYINSQNSRIWSELYVSGITAETLHRVASNMRKRVNACIAECGEHFQHLISLFFVF